MPSSRTLATGALLLRGSLITLKRKCGRPECRCARGELHRTPALSYSAGGVTHMVMLHDDALPRVQAALARYQHAQELLERRVQTSMTALRAQLAQEKAAARRGRGGAPS